ncbi:L,D-transpeptidase [bacterium]|nr:L,D-transpeptidase [bacterium]
MSSVASAEEEVKGVAQEDYIGEVVKAENSSAVFYISPDNKKHYFPDEITFLSWFDSFDHIKIIPSDDLKNIEFGTMIKYKPTEYSDLDFIFRNGTIVRQKNSIGYFYIENGEKRVFTSDQAFLDNGFIFADTIIADIGNYPWARAINSLEENLIPYSELSKPISKSYDSDQDGLMDYVEKYIYYTEMYNPDTDGDGELDGLEIKNNNSPRHQNQKLIAVDSDQDYLNDYFELKIGTDLMNADTDKDLYLDGTEVAASYNPLHSDSGKKSEKLIKINIAQQKLEYYFDNKLIDNFSISSGIRGMDTPTGEFIILDKEESKRYGGPGYDFDYPDTKWNLHFTTQKYRYYIHGAYWHNNFGNKMSHGCVNVAYDNMKDLYWFTNTGTKVVIE